MIGSARHDPFPEGMQPICTTVDDSVHALGKSVHRAGPTGVTCVATRGRPSRAVGGRRGAPRGALLYPRRSREELGGRFLGPMAYLDPKGEGDQSMPGK
jgi:hypothetical protein